MNIMQVSKKNQTIIILVVSLILALGWQVISTSIELKNVKSELSFRTESDQYWTGKRVSLEAFIYQNVKNDNFKDTSVIDKENSSIILKKDNWVNLDRNMSKIETDNYSLK